MVANAMLVKRSIKAIPNNSPWFLFIDTELEVDAIILHSKLHIIYCSYFWSMTNTIGEKMKPKKVIVWILLLGIVALLLSTSVQAWEEVNATDILKQIENGDELLAMYSTRSAINSSTLVSITLSFFI